MCSCNPDLGMDVADLFKYLTGYHRQVPNLSDANFDEYQQILYSIDYEHTILQLGDFAETCMIIYQTIAAEGSSFLCLLLLNEVGLKILETLLLKYKCCPVLSSPCWVLFLRYRWHTASYW